MPTPPLVTPTPAPSVRRRTRPLRSTARPRPVVALAAALAALALLGLVGCGADPGAAPPGTVPGAGRKITVAGDSISIGLGASIRAAVTAAGDRTEVKVIGEEGTGLARPDRFDWPTRLQQLARDFPPTVLVFSVSSNDAQDLTDATGKVVVPLSDPAAWDAAYRQRLGAAFDAFAGTGTTVVWVGHVRTADALVGATNRHIQELAAAVASSRPFVRVADLATVLGTGEQKAQRCLRPDGLHLTNPCLDEAATKLLPQLQT
jgi:uncharacterized protein